LERTEARYRNETRGGATRALGKLGIASGPAVARLIALLRDPWFRVRTAAAWSLGKLKPPEAGAAIAEALRTEPLDQVRYAFRAALERIQAKAGP